MELKELSFNWDGYNGKLKLFQKHQIIKIMDDYYNSDLTVAKIIDKYAISGSIQNLSKEFPKVFLDEKCPYDNSNLVKQMPSRSGISERVPQCTVCGHKLKSNCNCDGCQKKRKRMQEQRRNVIVSTYSTDVGKVKSDNLSVTSKVFLSAILRAGLNDEATKISGEKIMENKLSPTQDFDQIILKHLLSENVILVDPMSPLDAFPSNNFPNEYYIFKVNYLLNVDIDPAELGTLEYLNRLDIIKNKDECLGIWKQIALYECLEYLVSQMNEAKFTFNPQEKTRITINHLIEQYSIGQIWNLIYGSVNNAAAWYQKSNVTKKHAANSVITTLNNRGDRAQAEHWNLKPYHRSYDNKLSQISMVFFYGILQIGTKGYEEVPSIELIQ